MVRIMSENSKIEWTDHTVNFWWGCTKVSPACSNCYAEGMDARFHSTSPHWGPEAPRLLRLDAAYWEAHRYENRAVKEGRRFRIFTNSMSDFFEDRRDLDGARLEALETIRQTPHLDWMILTKRPEKIRALLRQAMIGAKSLELAGWLDSWSTWRIPPANVWLGTTVEDQQWANERIPALLDAPATIHFLSVEPILGPVDLDLAGGLERQKLWKKDQALYAEVAYNYPNLQIPGIDWVICGGESGPYARSMNPHWAMGLRHQCASAGVPFFFKQWGEFCSPLQLPTSEFVAWDAQENAAGNPDIDRPIRFGKARTGRLLDGVEHNAFPEVRP